MALNIQYGGFMLKVNIQKALACLIVMSFFITGCGNNENDISDPTSTEAESHSVKAETEDMSYMDNLENNTYYILHADKSCEPVLFGEASFNKGDISSVTLDSRIMWFKENVEELPTMYAGDSLIYYSTDILPETFQFERFEDFGYSLGFCQMNRLASGRLSISTDPNDRCTYPGGDTDEILKLTNDVVVLDKIGGLDIRVPDESVKDPESDDALTRVGTLTNLTQGKQYQTEIYEGTIKHEYIFTADVRIFGSMETCATTSYSFESETVINIKVPEYFKTGYYLINGEGLFRYINGNAFDAETQFSEPNEYPKKDENGNFTNATVQPTEQPVNTETQETAVASESEDVKKEEPEEKSTSKKETTYKFEIQSPSKVTVMVTFEGEDDSAPMPSAIIKDPEGSLLRMSKNPNGDGLLSTFMANEKGIYTIMYYELGSYTPNVSVSATK